MNKLPALLVNYNYSPDWLLQYPEIQPVIYDRSDDGIERNLPQYGATYKTKNIGDVDYDKLGWLIENYDNLPDYFLWSKSNLFKFIAKEELDKIKDNKVFTPVLTQNHITYGDYNGTVCKYEGGIYKERADSWFFNQNLDTSGRFKNWGDWIRYFHLPEEHFIPFAPGGSYILTPESIHRYSKDFYEEMRNTLPYAQHPVEAHCCERSYWYLWH